MFFFIKNKIYNCRKTKKIKYTILLVVYVLIGHVFELILKQNIINMNLTNQNLTQFTNLLFYSSTIIDLFCINVLILVLFLNNVHFAI
jgi:hypothetical protein